MASDESASCPAGESATCASGVTATTIYAPTMTGYPTSSAIWRPDLWVESLR